MLPLGVVLFATDATGSTSATGVLVAAFLLTSTLAPARGRIVDRGTHEQLLERCPLYEEIAEKGLEDSVYLQRDLEDREAGRPRA